MSRGNREGMLVMADNNADTLAWGRRQIPSPSPEINANVMITDRGSMQSRRREREVEIIFCNLLSSFLHPGEKTECPEYVRNEAMELSVLSSVSQINFASKL